MRGKPAPKRIIPPDPKFQNSLVTKFTNYVMKSGKKSIAEKIVYKAFDIMHEKTKQSPLELFDAAIKNVMPLIEVRGRRIGGANYQIPIPVRGDRKYSLAFRWILTASRTKKGRPMHEKLAAELLAAANREGDAVKKKNDVHKMAEANRAFAHFARFSR
ncbi:30S ribosomal protein S7 [Candidatus Uhrbacteria bacterium]|nr:30S ribosomal protein S7 [Candidatus Uhrbacteria bacterium]